MQEVNIMQLVEQHVISKRDPRYAPIDAAAFASKNLYNAANYELRQAFIHEGRSISYNQLAHSVARGVQGASGQSRAMGAQGTDQQLEEFL
jgi:hypothetical protein